MLLKKLTLQNIRSYSNQAIEFSAGSTLLAGDIGAGKSSILLAIEFALFGTSRPDLPGEHLLRKGSAQGAVELEFSLNKTHYIIKRTLKRDKHGVKQTTGFLVTNGVKKELTAKELKTAIVTILGYPQDVISKNKNYIFHYTIYTPQESMKFILQDNSDTRLNVLRKIFNVDKYKIIRDNIWLYCKELRLTMARLEGKLEPLESLEKEQAALQEQAKQVQLEVQDQSPKVAKIRQECQDITHKKEQLSTKQEERVILQSSTETMQARREEKKAQQARLALQQGQLEKELELLEKQEQTKQVVEEKVTSLKIEKETLIRRTSSLQEKIKLLQERITTLQQEQREDQQQKDGVTTKKQELLELEQQLSRLEQSGTTQTQLQELRDKTSAIITRNTTLLEQSKTLQETILGLDTCPTCQQQVSNEHKTQICEQENQKTTKAQNLLFEAQKKAQQIHDQLIQIEQDKKALLEKSNLKTRLELEIMQAASLDEKIQARAAQMKQKVQENNALMQELEKIEVSGSLQDITRRITALQATLQALERIERVEESKSLVDKEIKRAKQEIQELESDLEKEKILLAQIPDHSEHIKELDREFELKNKMLQEEQMQLTRLQTQLEEFTKQHENVEIKIQALRDVKSKLITKKQIHFWLNEHFIKLTYAIEKQVMVRIHALFNELFQEWFTILLDDENLYARIDDSFSPVLEQNGYEVGYSNLSGGEKTCVALAYRLALNRVINDVVHEIKTKDLLILDEPTDGFSSAQLDKVRDVLERLNLNQTIIVSHENKIESFVQNVIRVSKSGHVSEVSS